MEEAWWKCHSSVAESHVSQGHGKVPEPNCVGAATLVVDFIVTKVLRCCPHVCVMVCFVCVYVYACIHLYIFIYIYPL